MKIKSLEIIGFKSFVDRVLLDFQQDITGIVGPNGCGKSNIVDAIRWGMGEQSAKNLRGKQMEDIIFGGSESRKPLGMAEVSLVFSTEDGKVPAKYLNYAEIQVTRRLYRDGDSEYYLNKTPCRLLDITELFMDTGVGARAYSIIEQGKIGVILHSKPEERRFLIEEAAGVTKFKARKQVALRKIEHTRQNLLRLGDIISEIKRQLGSLQRQAKKAEKFRQYREELKEIDQLFAVRQYDEAQAEREQISRELAELSSREAALSASREQSELQLEERRIALMEQEKTVTAAQEEVYRLKGEIQTLENRAEFRKKELENLERHRVRFEEERSSLERQIEEARRELTLLAEQKVEFSRTIAEEEDALSAREEALEELVRAEGGRSRRLEEKRRELFSLMSEIAQLSNVEKNARRRLESMSERFERNRRESAELAAKHAEQSRRTGELEANCAGLVDRKEQFQELSLALNNRMVELKERLGELDRALQSGRTELSSVSSRLRSLKELEASFEGYGQGVKTLLLSERFKGRFRCLIADAVETDEANERALEAALGERLQHLVCDGDKDLLEAIAFLKEQSGGRGSFILEGVAPAAGGTGPEGTSPLLSRVRIHDAHASVITPLLADVHLAEDLAEAVSLARRYPQLRFVTADGDIAGFGGMVTGGAPEAAGPGLIHKKREIRELTQREGELSEQVRETGLNRERTQNELADVENEIREVRQSLHQTEIALVNAEKDLQRSREESSRIEERMAVKKLEDDQLAEEKALLDRELEESSRGRDLQDERRGELEREVESLQGELREIKEQMDELRNIVTSLKVRTASLREKHESAIRSMARLEELSAGLVSRIAAQSGEIEKGGIERERLVDEIARGDEELRETVLKTANAESAFGSIRQKYEEESQLLQEQEIQLRSVRSEADEVRQEVSGRQVRLSELSLRLQHLENSLFEKYRVRMEDAAPAVRGAEFDQAERRERHSELSRMIDEMGEVNLTAIEEFKELEERFEFLTSQKADLEESMQSLQQAIQRINRTTRKRFLETFHLVNTKFQELFPRLFCGGKAELRLTDEEDLLETGIDIIVQPPGKKLQNVTLLSGGEKALTALSLIFAIFLIKPSPFCLLDEVDAPLDDANITRFNDMIREMSSISQFIMITHNKGTMAVADTLYGITMEEPGVSRLVSVKLS